MKRILILMIVSSCQLAIANDDYHLPDTDVYSEKLAAAELDSDLIKVASATMIKDIKLKKGGASYGTWSQTDQDTWQWSLKLNSKNATSLNIGMTDFFLPHSAVLTVQSGNKFANKQTFTDQNNPKHGFLWTGEIDGEVAHLTLKVSAQEKQFVRFNINNVARGFYNQEDDFLSNKSGSCNVDVACDEGNWEGDINAVGRYTFQTTAGGFLCTGQLINNTSNDGTPYFLTADHCGYSNNTGQATLTERQNVAASIQVIWNYQSQTCRTPGSTQSGIRLSTSGFNQRQTGASYIASNPFTDVALVKLNQTPNASFNLEYAGWDRTDNVPNSATSIHHPSGHAKRISHEINPLAISSYSGLVGVGNGSHFRVDDWDVGTTEGGSSGAGLWNAEHLLVGQLHGGTAACGNDDPDWYGRFSKSWDEGSDEQSRLKEWLDPVQTGQVTLQGSAGCEAPIVQIDVLGSQKVGSNMTLLANVTGGAGDYTFEWDTNADEIIDAQTQDVQITYSQDFIDNVSVKVTDDLGCSSQASQALTVVSANVQVVDVQNIQSDLVQMCGNNDSVIDPGERWKTQLFFENQGNSTATGSFAALAKNRGGATASAGTSDNYGNSSSACDSDFIDISTTGDLKPWILASNEYPAHDEGATASISIANSALYGIGFSSLRASTNGYLSPGNINGTDFSNDCPLPAAPSHDTGAARIAPMHSDLQNSQLYHQSFSDCPRSAESGDNLACEIFMWKGADFWDTNATEAVDFQAILYPETGQWAYQYRGQAIDGSISTTGIQNAAGNDGISFACNQDNSISQNQAVCIFDKDHPNQDSDPDAVFLETPALDLGSLSPGDTTSKEIIFSVRTDAQCGKSFAINHEASVFDEGFNLGTGNVFEAEIGANGECSVITQCDINDSSDITANNGLWWNPKRSGNGTDFHFINQERLVYVNYTGLADRSPIWYITGAEDEESNQYFNSLLYVHHNGPFVVGQGINEAIGWSNTTLIDDNNLIQTRQIGDEFSAEKMEWYQFAAPPTTDQNTGLWFTPSESGWGQSVSTQGEVRGVVHYLYDAAGEPYWAIGWGDNNDSSLDLAYTQSFCPSCPRIEPVNTLVGSSRLTLDGQQSGTLNNISIEVPNDLRENTTWGKTNLPVSNLAPVNNQ